MREVIDLPIDALEPHPAGEDIPLMTDEELASLKDSIAIEGVIEPLDIMERDDQDGYWILDGRHRWWSCRDLVEKDAQFSHVPTLIREPTDPFLYILQKAIENRQLSKSQRGALVLKREEYVEQLDEKASARMKNGNPVVNSLQGRVVEHLARDAHVGSQLMYHLRYAKRHAPDLFERVVAGELTAHSAYKEAKKRVEGTEDWKPRRFNVWPAWKIEPFQEKYDGQLPAELLRNVLHYTTDVGDLVVDPFGGGGNMALVCREMERHCITMDIAPDPERENIIKHDAREPFPLGEADIGDVQLVFLDPPYWKQKRHEADEESQPGEKKKHYSLEDGELANAPTTDIFYDMLVQVCQNAEQVLASDGFLVLIIGASQFDDRFYDHASEMYCRLNDHWQLENRVTASYPTSQYGPPAMARAAKKKQMLNLRTDILFFKGKRTAEELF